jgi:hypothetical protein
MKVVTALPMPLSGSDTRVDFAPSSTDICILFFEFFRQKISGRSVSAFFQNFTAVGRRGSPFANSTEIPQTSFLTPQGKLKLDLSAPAPAAWRYSLIRRASSRTCQYRACRF